MFIGAAPRRRARSVAIASCKKRAFLRDIMQTVAVADKWMCRFTKYEGAGSPCCGLEISCGTEVAKCLVGTVVVVSVGEGVWRSSARWASVHRSGRRELAQVAALAMKSTLEVGHARP